MQSGFMQFKKLRILLPAAALMAAAGVAWAETPKLGLWETTMTMKWVKSPFPAGLPVANIPAFSGKPITHSSCLTQKKLDEMQDPFAGREGKECKLENVQKSDHGMTADMVCSGHMNGKGSFEIDWSGGDRATMKSHFAGTMQMGNGARDVEWTNEGTSVYKGSSCGSVKED